VWLGLVVHPPDRALLPVVRDVALQDVKIQAAGFELLAAERPGEKSPLVVDPIGFNGWTRLDTRGHPHSDKLHVVQRFRRTDAGHIVYMVTIDDPVFYTKPWTNERTFTLTTGDLIEYSCQENNRSLWEGRIKLWIPPGSSPPRTEPAKP